MKENASVSSVDVLVNLESALARTASVIRSSIPSIGSQARRQLDVLSDRCRELQREVDFLQRELDYADDDRDIGRIFEKLDETRERLGKARYWLTRAEDAYHNFAKHEQRMMELATERTASARDLLVKSAEDLRRYLAVQPTGGSGIGATLLAGSEDGVAAAVGALTAERQIGMAVERLSQIPGVQPGAWASMTFESKLATLQTVEQTMAEIQRRSAAAVVPVAGEPPNWCGGWNGHTILVNECHLQGNPQVDAQVGGVGEVVGTIVHEGRHAYQSHAMSNPGFHANTEQVNAWRWNSGRNYILRERNPYLYEHQAVESDAFSYEQAVKSRLSGGGSQ